MEQEISFHQESLLFSQGKDTLVQNLCYQFFLIKDLIKTFNTS